MGYESEDCNELIRINKSKKDKQYNGQKKKDKSTNNDLKHNTQKTKDRVTPIPLKKTGVNSMCSGRENSSAPLVASVSSWSDMA